MRKQHLAVAVLLLALSSTSATASDARTIIWLSHSSRVAEGAHLIENGDPERGMKITLEALKENLLRRDQAAALNNLCTAELALRRLRDAIKHCTTAITLRGSLWQSYNNRANAYFMLGDYDAAISDYNRALLIRPDLDIVEYNLTLAIDRKARNKPPIVEEWES